MVLVLFLMGVIFFSTINNVYAKILTIDEISGKFSTSIVIESLNQLEGVNFSSVVNSTNNTLYIYNDSEKVMSFYYTDDYIEYNNRDAVVTQENFSVDIGVAGVMQTILELSEYDNKTLIGDEDYTDTFETYGIQMETEYFSFKTDNGNMSGDFIKYFKMSFDTDKIDSLMDKYGTDISNNDPNKEIIANLTPTLEAKDITTNSVTLYPHINYVNTDSDYKVFCYIYRSTSEDGTYEKISDMAVNCMDGIGFVDEDLDGNTTYYYKTSVVDGIKYSDIIQVTTKDFAASEIIPSSTNSNNDDLIENPQTGQFFPVATTILMLIGSFVIFMYVRKKSVFRKI